jgi:cobalt-zinc-cadmium efflux system outer membrane protein
MQFCSVSSILARKVQSFSILYFLIRVAVVLTSVAALPAQGQTRLTLHDAIRAAQNSPLVRMGQAQVMAARGGVKQAGLRPNPRLFLQSEDLRPWSNNFNFSDNTEDYAFVSQTIETAGKRSARQRYADANLRETKAHDAFQLQQLAGRVAATYWTAVSTARISQLLAEDLAAVDEMVRYHQQRVDAGAMRGADLLRMQIERDRLFIALQAAQRDATLARVDLGRQIGHRLEENIELSDSIDTIDAVPHEELAEVLARRQDVVVAQEAVAAAEADVKLQKSLRVPDFDVVGGYKRNSGADTLYSGLQIPLPFWNRNQGEVQRASANVQVAQAQLDEMKLTVEAEVNAATEAYTREQQIVEKTLPEMREHASKNLAIMSDAYKSGGVDLLRYIDAERTEIEVESNALRTLSEFHQSALRLELAYGVQP